MKYFLVAIAVGGIMECPEFSYHEPLIIEAESPEEAEKIYNKKKNCSYFYGSCRGEVIDGKVTLPVKEVKIEFAII